MIISEIPVVLDSTAWAHEGHTRTPGLHISGVLRSMERDLYGREKGEGISDQELEVFRTVGFLLEHAMYDVVLRGLGVERLGEFEYDGLLLTPDAVYLDSVASYWAQPNSLIETKATWRSAPPKNDIVDDFEIWWEQVRCYLKALGLRRATLWALFMNGVWRPPRPQLRRWDAEFEQWEVDATWKRVKNHSIWMKETGRS